MAVGPAVMGCVVVTGTVLADVLSLQPQNLPGVRHVVLVGVGAGDEIGRVVVTVGAPVWSVVVVVVVLSLQPNHPGVLQVLVVDVDVVVSVVVVVVVSSRHPHQPGVWQVAVRVFVLVDVEDDEVVVVPSVPLLSYIFQLAQSRHSGVNLHSGTSSYFMITSWMTARILCVPMPTRQPLSPTTS